MMKKTRPKILCAALTTTLMLVAMVSTAAAGPYEDALTAYKNRDFATAARLFRPLASQGDIRAQYKLGTMYANGQGVQQNFAEAANWLHQANNQKSAYEAYNRGDYVTALRLYRPLAEQGEPVAEYVIGLMYANGQGVPQSYTVAMKWHKKLADAGEPIAQFSVGVMYLKGLGVPRNLAKAAKWFQKAADQGDAKAQYNLGSMYVKGQGVPQNYVRADMLLSLAATQGIEAAKNAEKKLSKSMTPAQLVKAQKLARDWKLKPAR